MGVSVKPVFNRAGKTNKSGLYKVNIRVTVDRRHHYLDVPGFPKLNKKYWHPSGMVRNTHPHNYELNKILRDAVMRIEAHVARLSAAGQKVNWTAIRDYYNAANLDDDFVAWARRYIRRDRTIIEVTKNGYRTMINWVERFSPQLTVKNIDREFVENFLDWLRAEGYSKETIRKGIIRLRKLYFAACRENGVGGDLFLFHGLALPRGDNVQVRLSGDELRAIEELKLAGSKLEYLRDVFLFQAFTGLYYSDVRLLTNDFLVKMPDGRYYLTNKRYKNAHVYVVPLWLHPIQMKIIERYKNESGRLFDGLPAEQTYNKKLKLLAAMAGIDKRISNKTARHTFTQWLITKGMPRQFVAPILGHHREETTQFYYDISPEILLQNIDRFV